MMQNRRGGFGPAEGGVAGLPVDEPGVRPKQRACSPSKRARSPLVPEPSCNEEWRLGTTSCRQRTKTERTNPKYRGRPFVGGFPFSFGLVPSNRPRSFSGSGAGPLFKSPAAARGRPNSLCAGCAAPAYEQAFLVHRRGRTITLLAQKSGANVRCHLKLGRSRRRIANGGYGA